MVGDIENHIEAGAEVRDLVPQPVQIEVVLCRVRGGAGLGKRERERERVRVRVRVRERERAIERGRVEKKKQHREERTGQIKEGRRATGRRHEK